MGGGLSIVLLKLLSDWTGCNLCFGFVCVRIFLLWSLSIVLRKFIERRKDSGVNRYHKLNDNYGYNNNKFNTSVFG